MIPSMENKRKGLLAMFGVAMMAFVFCYPALAQDNRIVIPDSLLNRPLKNARIVFEEREYDFGKVSRSMDTLMQHTFVFQNDGDKDLVVMHAMSGCGCTTPAFTKEPLKPKQKGQITVSYRGKTQQLGYFRKSVTVFSNDPRSYVRIFIKGELVK